MLPVPGAASGLLREGRGETDRMLCSRVQNYLSAYLDSELPGEEMLGIRAHLHHCELCEGELEALRRTRRLMQSLRNAEPRHPFNLDVALAERGARPSWFRLWTLRAIGALEVSPLGVLLFLSERARVWDELRRQARLATLCATLGVVVLAAVLVQQPQKPDTVLALVPADMVRMEDGGFFRAPVDYPVETPSPFGGPQLVSYSNAPFLGSRPGSPQLLRFVPVDRQFYREVGVFPVMPGHRPGYWTVVELP